MFETYRPPPPSARCPRWPARHPRPPALTARTSLIAARAHLLAATTACSPPTCLPSAPSSLLSTAAGRAYLLLPAAVSPPSFLTVSCPASSPPLPRPGTRPGGLWQVLLLWGGRRPFHRPEQGPLAVVSLHRPPSSPLLRACYPLPAHLCALSIIVMAPSLHHLQ
jgi:hypothetical protein